MRTILTASLAVFLSGFSAHAFQLKALSNEQVIEDLHEMRRLIRLYYGPLQMKEKTIQFQLDKLIEDAETEIKMARNENEAVGVLVRALGKLNDGHVSITFPEYASAPGRVKIPIFLTPIENRAIVGIVEPAAMGRGIDVGDEVLTIDGKKAMEFVEIASRYQSFGNARSNQHLLYRATQRPVYMTEIAPTEPEARLEVKKPNGKVYPVNLVWRPESVNAKNILFVSPSKSLKNDAMVSQSESFNAATGATVMAMGSTLPFFVTPQSTAAFKITSAPANAESLEKFKVAKEKVPPIYSALYKSKDGKNVLLVRQPTYTVDNAQQSIQHYKAILSQYEPFADVLVLDQTHNPGGQSTYLEAFFRLFIEDKAASVVQFMRADRKWVRKWEMVARAWDPNLESEDSRQALLRAKMVESSNERGDFFTPSPVPLNQDAEVSPDPEYTWKKPMLILTDELAGSCGDIFPMMMKKVGKKTFGQPTMGLGGSVEPVGELSFTGGELNLTRGLFALYNGAGMYDDKSLVENSGIPVDYAYEHTVEDFRGGFVKYMEELTKAAVEQIPEAK